MYHIAFFNYTEDCLCARQAVRLMSDRENQPLSLNLKNNERAHRCSSLSRLLTRELTFTSHLFNFLLQWGHFC